MAILDIKNKTGLIRAAGKSYGLWSTHDLNAPYITITRGIRGENHIVGEIVKEPRGVEWHSPKWVLDLMEADSGAEGRMPTEEEYNRACAWLGEDGQ
jgi:hypothetical protein